MFRNSMNRNVTSGKLHHGGAWQDLKVVIDHVYSKYVFDKKSGQKRTSFYAYGCSMGAFLLGHYMSKDSSHAVILDGAVLYAGIWDFVKQT